LAVRALERVSVFLQSHLVPRLTGGTVVCALHAVPWEEAFEMAADGVKMVASSDGVHGLGDHFDADPDAMVLEPFGRVGVVRRLPGARGIRSARQPATAGWSA
jgi:hypothetical protein